MVTVIANQKRTTATYGKDLPLTFDPLDGNAKEWLYPYIGFTGHQHIPCVYNWMRIALRYQNDTPWEPYPMELEYTDSTTESFDLPDNRFDQYSYGSDDELIEVGTFWTSTGSTRTTELIVPVWGRDVVAVRGSLEITSNNLIFGADASTRFGRSGMPDRFFYDTDTFTLGTYIIDYEVTIANTGKVSHSLTIS